MHREVARRSIASSLCIRTRPLPIPHKAISVCARSLSNDTNSWRAADSDKPKSSHWSESTPIEKILETAHKSSATITATSQHPRVSLSSELSSLASLFQEDADADASTDSPNTSRLNGNSSPSSSTSDLRNADFPLLHPQSSALFPNPQHHLHIYATKHNTHITLTRPNRDAIISVSAGNIGFRKAGRGSYDAAYQLAAYMLSRIQDQGLIFEIKELEVVLRGWGQGREAVTKAILGNEGRLIRGKIVKVTDATRLKYGGTRSKKPRRLG